MKSVLFSTFSCFSQLLLLIPERFCHSERKPCAHELLLPAPSPQSLAAAALLSVLADLPVLGASRKRDHMCCVYSLSRVRLSATPRPAARQAPLSMGILQARTLEWVAMPSSRGSSPPRDQTQVSQLQENPLLSELSVKPMSTGVGSLSLLRGILLTQELNGVSCVTGRFSTS